MACRRYLVLRSCGNEVPAHAARECGRLLARCSNREMAKMRSDALDWFDVAAWTRRSRALPVRDGTFGAPALDTVLRTAWRPAAPG